MKQEVDSGSEKEVSHVARRSGRAGLWQLTATLVQAAIAILNLAVLSRLLSPEDFGIVALAMIFVNFAAVSADSGMTAALVQRRSLNERHLRVAFTTSALIGSVMVLAVLVGAERISLFFRAPELAALLKLLSISFLLIGCGQVADALLWRSLRLHVTAFADIAGSLAYGVVAIVLALSGFGIWSLAWAVIAQFTTRTAIVYGATRHSLRPYLGRLELRELMGFGFGMSLVKMLNMLAGKADYVVVGRLLGTASLGLYERAFRLMEFPSNSLAGVINKIGFPVMAEFQHDRDRAARIYIHGMNLTTLVYLPMAVFFWFAAPQLIPLVFGAKWAAATLPFQILCLGLLFRALNKVSESLSRAVGAVYENAWRVALYLVAVILAAYAGSPWGLVGVSIGGVAALLFRFILVSHLGIKVLHLSWPRYLASFIPGTVMALAVTIVLALVQWGLQSLSLTPLASVLLTLAATLCVCASAPFLMPVSWLGSHFFDLLRLFRRGIPFRLQPVEFLLSREASA